MNKKTGELYGDLMDYIYQYIPSDGDGRLECEGKLHLLIKSVEKDAYDSGYKDCHFNNFKSKDDVIGI